MNDKKSNQEEKKEESGLIHRLNIIVDASSVTYYHRVQVGLPEVAQKAVLATLGEKNYSRNEHEKVFTESLKKLKRMMVFYRLREDKKVTETILYSAVYANLKDVSASEEEVEASISSATNSDTSDNDKDSSSDQTSDEGNREEAKDNSSDR